MTFFSNHIYKMDESGEAELVTKLTLDRYSPFKLANWAKQAGLDRETFLWVDDCWVKVPATASQVGLFLDAVMERSAATELKAVLSPAVGYLIEAEEF